MSEPYLVLHKVRGQPAFDIAERVRCPNCGGVGGHNNPDFETGIVGDYEGASCDVCDGLGFWWIIPTSGHRAYPLEALPLSDLEDRPTNWSIDQWQKWALKVRPIADWPDHYPTSPHTPNPSAPSLAQRLGLVKPAPIINRRL